LELYPVELVIMRLIADELSVVRNVLDGGSQPVRRDVLDGAQCARR